MVVWSLRCLSQYFQSRRQSGFPAAKTSPDRQALSFGIAGTQPSGHRPEREHRTDARRDTASGAGLAFGRRISAQALGRLDEIKHFV